jgi:AraC-like DNA-binding protein
MLLDRLLSNLDVDVEPFAMCLVSEGWRLRLPGPPEVLLHFVLQGRGSVLDPDDVPHPFSPGSFAVIPRGAAHAIEAEGPVENEENIPTPCQGALLPQLIAGGSDDPPVIVACGIIKVRYGESLGLFDHLHDVLSVEMSDTPTVGAAFRAILEEQSQAAPRPGSDALTAALMNQCLVQLFRRLSESEGGQIPWLGALTDSRLARALQRILEEPAESHTVESLAEAASMSRSTFAERFTAAFGRTPMNLVNHARMQRAAHLLGQDDTLSIDQIAERVGFSSRSHFSRAFKKHTGVAPAEFRTDGRATIR